tara:strand:+ start:958 stop:2652 length:1695 start_codon:yes stop_codon:yes gene_type:complete
MGYITKSTTVYLDLHMTNAGRRLLLQGSLSDNMIKFALGDTDVDYRNALQLSSGEVPDVTGEHLNCIFGVNGGYDIKRKLEYTLGQATTSPSLTPVGSLVSGFRNASTGGQMDYSTDATVKFYVADMFTSLKALAMTQIPYHQWNGMSATTYTNYFKTIQDAQGRNYSARYTQLFEDMEYGLGRGWFANLVDGFYVSEGGNIKNCSVRIEPESPKDGILLRKLTSAALVNQSNQTITNNLEKTAKIGTRKTRAYISPFTVATEGLKSDQGVFNGSGPLSICNALADYGYVVGSIINKKVTVYPEYGIKSDAGGYYHPQIIENSSYSTILNATGLDTLTPSARIIDNNNTNTNFYYPLQTNQINNEPGDRRFRGKENSDYLGSTGIRNSTTATETALNFFAGTPELELTKQTSGNLPQTLRMNRRNITQEPNIGLARIVQQTEDFFYALSKDPEVSNWVTTSGTGKNSVYSFNIALRISAQDESKKYKSCKVNLNFIFSVPALQPTFTWQAPTPSSSGRWLVFNSAAVQIYGAGYTSMGGHYTSNPTQSVTTSGESIYRKIILNT